MKKLSLFLALMLLFSSIGLTAFAQEEVQLSPRFSSYDEVNEAITVIPSTDSQAELGYLKGITAILEVDGLQFKDLNGNGKLDVYEDWRQDIDARVKDLYDQMTLEERAGLFYHVNTCGDPTGVDFADSRYMFAPGEIVNESAGEGSGGNAAFPAKSMCITSTCSISPRTWIIPTAPRRSRSCTTTPCRRWARIPASACPWLSPTTASTTPGAA